RAQVYGRLLPEVGTLLQTIGRRRRELEHGDVENAFRQRLSRLRQLCEASGARLVIIVSPTARPDWLLPFLPRARADVRVDVLVPLEPLSVPAPQFPDGMHLDRDGALKFTAALVTALKQAAEPSR